MTVEENRPITPSEITVVDWLLRNAVREGLFRRLADSVEGLRVVGRCNCGCASVDFEKDGQSGRSHPIADAVGETHEGLQCGLILWGRDDAVTGLEVYELDPGSADMLPSTETLKP